MQHISTITDNICVSARHTESPIEVILFQKMLITSPFVLCQENDEPNGEGYFIFPQMQIGQYRADFIIRGLSYIPYHRVWPPKLQATICVECDGMDFHSSTEQKEHDKKRDSYFLEQGIKTLRFSGYEINKDPRFCVDQIASFLQREMANYCG